MRKWFSEHLTDNFGINEITNNLWILEIRLSAIISEKFRFNGSENINVKIVNKLWKTVVGKLGQTFRNCNNYCATISSSLDVQFCLRTYSIDKEIRK